jgi:hypothetical protein
MEIDGKNLVIEHYELKEIRKLQKEEEQDLIDWNNFIAQK